MELINMQMCDLSVFAFFGVPIPVNIKCVHHLAKSHILSNHPKSVPSAHQ